MCCFEEFTNSEIKPTCKAMGFFVPGEKYINVDQYKVPSEVKSEQLLMETMYYSFFERNQLEYKIRDKLEKMTQQKKNPKKNCRTHQ